MVVSIRQINIYSKSNLLKSNMKRCIRKSFSVFVWDLSYLSRIFHAYGDVTITVEGLHILTYARHSWPLSREGSLVCHTYCDKGHPFIIVISEHPWHSHLMPSCHSLFSRLIISLSQLGFEYPTFRLWGFYTKKPSCNFIDELF